MPRDIRSALKRVRRLPARARRVVKPAPTESGDERDLILRSGFFDATWIGMQLGRTFTSDMEAVEAYLANAPACSPHPLFWGRWLDRSRGLPPRSVSALAWYLRNEGIHGALSPHPFIDVEALRDEDPSLWTHEHGPVVAWLQHHGPTSPLPVGVDLPPRTWGEVDAASRQAVSRWRKVDRHRQAPRTSPGPVVELQEPTSDSLASPPRSADPATPLVSVVMPVWNRGHMLRRAVESVQAQSLQNWELLIVDDGSTDDSVAVARGLAHFDDRIVVVAAEHRGVSAARNSALARARAPYVAFLDTDNAWRPHFLHSMVTAMTEGSLHLAHAALRASKDGQTYYRTFAGTYEHMLVAAYVDLNVAVVSRAALEEVGGFDETLRRAVDFDLMLKLARRHPPHLVPYLGVDYTDDSEDASRISVSESPRWLSVVVDRHQVDWDGLQREKYESVLTSVVVPVDLDVSPRRTWAWLRQFATRDDLEVIVVAVGVRRWQHVLLDLLVTTMPHARLVTQAVGRGHAAALNLGLAACRGERVVLAASRDGVPPETVDALTTALDHPGARFAQPLVVSTSDVISTAGAVFSGDSPLPRPWLADHATVDASSIPGDHVAVPALWGPVVAARTAEMVAAHGFDPLVPWPLATTDLCRRAGATEPGSCVLVHHVTAVDADPTAAVGPEDLIAGLELLGDRAVGAPPGSEAAWTLAGFEVVARHSDPVTATEGEPIAPDAVLRWPQPVVRPLRVGSLSVSEAAPSLRWTIDTAAFTGASGLLWGDLHFAEALARALRDLGQHVAVDRRDARHRSTRDLDDVVLALRGLDHVRPWPGAVNLEWIISHPELVTAQETARYDRVYAASEKWAARRREEWGVEVVPLLQATDPTLFRPDQAEPDSGAPVLFVGNSRGVFRSSVRHALTIGADLTVIGTGWHRILGDGVTAALYVDNAELASLYAGAGVVLNDHWEEMRVDGFVSNRLMDAAAAGARVATDPLPGVDLEALFGGLVQTFEGPDELRDLLDHRDERFPQGEARARAAREVGERHSFTTRARVLLDDAVRLRGAGRS